MYSSVKFPFSCRYFKLVDQDDTVKQCQEDVERLVLQLKFAVWG